MPRKKLCEHPTRHIDSSAAPKVQRWVGLRLREFMRDRYDLDDVNVSGLCAKCHAFESRQMAEDEAMDVEENISSSDDMSNDDKQEQDGKEEDDGCNDDNHDEEDDGCDDNNDEDNDDISAEDEVSDYGLLHELTYQQQEAMETLSTVFRMLNINPIHDQFNVVPIRRQIDQVYTNLHQLCDVLEGKVNSSIQANPHELSIEESNELITGLKKLFKESTPDEQVRLMTIAPSTWGRRKTKRWFQSTERHARRAIQLRDNNNVLAFPQYLRGNPTVSIEAINAVAEFYQDDDISRVSSNSKDVIQINKKPVAVRFMEMTVLDAFRDFDKRYPGLVGRSTFYSLRPRNVKIAFPHQTCMCIYHENMHLLLQAWSKNYQRTSKKPSTSAVEKFTMNNLINRMFCSRQSEDCYTGECDQCPSAQLQDLLTEHDEIDLDDDCSWTIWKKLNNKFDLQTVTGFLSSLLYEIEEQWPYFLLHAYYNRQQREYINYLRKQSSDQTFITAQIDFSMNYNLIRQREVQQGFFSQQQATLFTVHLTIGAEHREMAIVSDFMEHTTTFVYCAQSMIVSFVKKHFPCVKKINYIR